MKYFFMHIPKTAGISLHLLLKKNVNPDEILSIYKKESIFDNCSEWATLEEVDNNPSKYRNKKYFIGHFIYGMHDKLSILDSECSYITFLRNPIDLTISTYHQMYKHIDPNKKPSILDFLNLRLDNNTMRAHISGNTTLDQAFENINTHFIHLGFVESYRQSIKTLCHKLNWKNDEEIVENVTDNTTKNSLIIDDIIKNTILKRSEDDHILYNRYYPNI